MARNLAYLIGMVITIVIGIYFYLSCCSCCAVSDFAAERGSMPKKSAPAGPVATSYAFSVQDGDFHHESSANFNFNVSSPSLLLPLSDSLKNAVTILADHLAQNTGKAVSIVGFYKADENNGTAYPNLGVARANSVKNHFVTQDIAATQINTSGELKEEMEPKAGILLGPISYSVGTIAQSADAALKALYDKIKTDPLVLRFNTGQAALNLSGEQHQKVADISKYLDEVDDAICNVIGHSDNTGRRATNIALAQERAEFVKTYLIQNGISGSRITVTSKGPDAPIASNDSQEGRAKNRRVVVTLN